MEVVIGVTGGCYQYRGSVFQHGAGFVKPARHRYRWRGAAGAMVLAELGGGNARKGVEGVVKIGIDAYCISAKSCLDFQLGLVAGQRNEFAGGTGCHRVLLVFVQVDDRAAMVPVLEVVSIGHVIGSGGVTLHEVAVLIADTGG